MRWPWSSKPLCVRIEDLDRLADEVGNLADTIHRDKALVRRLRAARLKLQEAIANQKPQIPKDKEPASCPTRTLTP